MVEPSGCANHPRVSERLTKFRGVILRILLDTRPVSSLCRASTEEAINSTNIPLTFVMKHFPLKVYNEVLGPPGFYEALCVGSDNIAGHCAMESEDSMKKVDHIGDELATAFWSVEDHAWADTKEEHLNMVRGAGSAFDWRPYSTEDLIFFDDRRGL